MKMILSKYPSVVQKELLYHMKLSYIFLLDQSWICANYKRNNVLRMKSFESEDTEYGYFQLNLSGKTIDFRMDENKLLVAFFHQCDIEAVIEYIHSYLLEFFGNSVKYDWKSRDRWPESDFRKDEGYIPYIRRLQNVTTTTEPFNSESKFYQAESIVIKQEEPSFPDILRYFQGRQASIECKNCKLSDLIEFVNRWKSGEAFQKLEYLKLGSYLEAFLPNQNEFLNVIAAKPIDATKKPPRHTLPKVFDISPYLSNTYPIVSHSYVVRESDNHVASVMIEEKTFRIGVWDETEEEFLIMMD